MASTYRGMQCAPLPAVQDVEDLLSWKANIIRYQITGNPDFIGPTEQDYIDWVNIHLDYLEESILPMLAARAKVIIDLHTPPYGYEANGTAKIFASRPDGRTLLYDMWREVAHRFKHQPAVFGYDLLNEPAGSTAHVADFMKKAADAIRAIDKDKRILITCPRSIPSNFAKTYFRKNDSRCLYVLHMYSPLPITHQGIGGRPSPKAYPTPRYNYAWMLKALKPVLDFQKKNRARICMNEFSISGFATGESRLAYLKDVIKIAEKFNWQWCYHAWREHPVWSAENDEGVTALFKKYFNKNKV
jgi:hypothetical protein